MKKRFRRRYRSKKGAYHSKKFKSAVKKIVDKKIETKFCSAYANLLTVSPSSVSGGITNVLQQVLPGSYHDERTGDKINLKGVSIRIHLQTNFANATDFVNTSTCDIHWRFLMFWYNGTPSIIQDIFRPTSGADTNDVAHLPVDTEKVHKVVYDRQLKVRAPFIGAFTENYFRLWARFNKVITYINDTANVKDLNLYFLAITPDGNGAGGIKKALEMKIYFKDA